MAGIAIGPTEQVWTFNRGNDPRSESTRPSGELVRTWGQGQFQEPHQVRIDREGNVWLVDSGLHVCAEIHGGGKAALDPWNKGRAGGRLHPFQSTDRRGCDVPGRHIRR